MKRYFADLHIHIGRTKSGRAVKITGSKNLTLTNILQTAKYQKGIDIVGVIDSHSPEVIEEIEELIQKGSLEPLQDGGLLFEGKTTLIMGSELEIYDLSCKGPIHLLCYLPSLEKMKAFSAWLATQLKNIHLSSQRIYTTGRELQEQVKALDGLFIPAHVFTPFKSLFGRGVEKKLTEVFYPDKIDAIELGLSSDTKMADHLKQLHRYPYITNSDAHSLPKIGREYQALFIENGSFSELTKALRGEAGRKIMVNYGLDPLLGKYYRTTCAKCVTPMTEEMDRCPHCGSKQKVKGVSERIAELTDTNDHPVRPPYVHQVPLDFLPGIGPKTLAKLLHSFGTEMEIIHNANESDLLKIIPEKTVSYIIKARNGELLLESGGGGRYGKIKHK
ncbi:endonuclease Q family protein [Caldibacillus lycopersici]|uniref:Endonuclease Q family protein n=1 Tax=Perspicuibacillus lycopersici TaxID=1325689 RepID=A0AAE3IT98_9BACI|nr:endonuclease Q family protein [Perspicuibacillus lycopersici]MCU9613772.1 endonuclease Q family protein [Perspicuibacillus lycopersici]